jgi:serine/threonine protein kinase
LQEAAVTEGWQVGAWRLVRRPGGGAMGEVWLGRHGSMGNWAAVKMLRRGRDAWRASFERERRAIARLSHPHVVRLFDVGEDWIATAWVDGGDLQRRLRTPLPPADSLRIVSQVGAALAHAHSAGVVHRDVKPGNILIDRRGNAFLGDFGLAAFAEDPESHLGGGTPAYMAPEVRRGQSAGPAADQYALALTLLTLLTGAQEPSPEPMLALDALPDRFPPGLCAALACALADPGQLNTGGPVHGAWSGLYTRRRSRSLST